MSGLSKKQFTQFDPNLLRNVVITPFRADGRFEVFGRFGVGETPQRIARETGFHETAIKAVLKRVGIKP